MHSYSFWDYQKGGKAGAYIKENIKFKKKDYCDIDITIKHLWIGNSG